MLLVDQEQTFSISRIDEKTTYLEDSGSDGPTFVFFQYLYWHPGATLCHTIEPNSKR